MKLIIARHGNTFGPNDKVVWAGSKQDYPLVEKGLEQAHNFADFLVREKITPKVIFCGPLKRTREFAQIAKEKLSLQEDPIIDNRLNEIDYGKWGGKADQEILDEFGAQALEDWNKRSIWCKDADWGGSEEEFTKEALSFLDDLSKKFKSDETVIAVSSNGKIRYFLKAILGEFENRVKENSFKIKTGNYCIMEYKNGWQIVEWNSKP